MAANLDAATAAWIEAIPASARAAAQARTSGELVVWLMGGVITLAACWLIQRSGLLTRLRDRAAGRPWLASFVGAAAFMALLLLAQAPFELWRTGWSLGSVAPEDVLRLTLGTLLLPLAMAVMRRAPRFGWAWLGGIGAVAILAVVWGPYAMASGPVPRPVLPAGPLSAGLAQVTRAADLGAPPIYEGGAEAPYTDVTGVPGAPRIVLDSLDAAATAPAEVKAEVAHLISHHRHGDQLALALLTAALYAAGLFAATRLLAPLARLVGAQGLSDPADPAALPVLAMIAVVWLGVARPALAGFLRAANVRADAEALAWSREPDGLAASVVRDWNRKAVAPSAVEAAVLYTHPPLQARLRQAMAWKAAHPDAL